MNREGVLSINSLCSAAFLLLSWGGRTGGGRHSVGGEHREASEERSSGIHNSRRGGGSRDGGLDVAL